jgi:hypothetical protein
MEYEPIEIHFSDEERKLAADEAYRRQKVNEEKKLTGRNGGAEIGDEALRIHLIGAAGEMAVASYLGLKNFLYTESEAKRGTSDLPPNIDVKTRAKEYYDLVVQLDDDPTKIYVLVTIENKRCIIHGWIHGKNTMKDQFYKDPVGGRPAYFIPKGLLSPISTLKEYLISMK